MTNKKNKSKTINPEKEDGQKKIAEAVILEKKISPRGRIFEGIVKKKFHKRVVIEFERTIYVRKYERYAKSRTKIHARLPEFMEKEINIGDLIKIQECRPLSKIIHFIVIEKIKNFLEVKK
ncbi:MAG: small subunit ribosomal protein S17 [archaeon GW2011_AR19]|nr:small subunit ribosomal protein S17 [uncultured archaeon]KHO55530.1 MAG: small subunit ribosomal protein S17 [archaeon GW2011_AR19]